MDLILEQGRPENLEGRMEKEVRVYEILDQLEISYDRVDHESAETMEACIEIDRVLGDAQVCKNLFLCNTQKTKFYLLMVQGGKKFQTKEISRQLGVARLSFATAEAMEEHLDILPGSVSVMGLMNDHQKQVQLLIDQELLEYEYFGCHPCVNTSSLRMKVRDLTDRFLPAVGHTMIPVQVSN